MTEHVASKARASPSLSATEQPSASFTDPPPSPLSPRHLAEWSQRLWALERHNNSLRFQLVLAESALKAERERTAALLTSLREERRLSPRNIQDEATIDYLRGMLAQAIERIGVLERSATETSAEPE